jgi:hypothetical protein
MLRNRSVDLRLEYRTDGDTLEVAAVLSNLAGHKFPTAYPERRAWIHLAMQDGEGRVFFESGAADAEGWLVPDAAEGYEPHQEVIREPDRVQIFEIVPGDAEGLPTRRLLSAARTLKDNRIPPTGFDPGRHALGEDCPVVGQAESDPDFDAQTGSDTVRYRVPAPGSGPVAVRAAVYYQSVPPAVVEDLARFNGEHAEAFLRQARATGVSEPELIAEATVTVRLE